MKALLLAILCCFFVASLAYGQTTPEIVMTDADIEIRFSGESDWINGGDATQTIFSVDSISYSAEPLSTDVKHTTKLNAAETWEVEMFRIGTDPFRKAVFVITIYQATSRAYELRVGNRYAGEDVVVWSLPTEDKVIGRPGKPINTR